MPETVNGYELFQLPCSNESEETLAHAEFVNRLGPDGHRSRVMYGSDTGLRRFSIPYNTLAGGAHAGTITVGGVTMNKATYIRDLFRRQKVSGDPFVIQSAENSQYYLVEFAESEQTLAKKLSALYATQINLVQVRIEDVTVFDVAQMSGVWGWYKGDNYQDLGGGTVRWTDQSTAGHNLTENPGGTADIEPVAAVQNGLGVMRFSDPGFFNTTLAPAIYEAFFILKASAATFATYQGILTASVTTAALVGKTGDTELVDFSFGSIYEYRKNGIVYAESNQQAPMNTFGLIHARWQGGLTLSNLQIGMDRDFSGRGFEGDIGEIVLFDTLQPLSYSRELAEHLQTRWNI